MDSIKLKICKDPSEAPVYPVDKYNSISLESAVVVQKGTVNGNSTVDLIFTDANGNRYVALVKASYLEMIGRV